MKKNKVIAIDGFSSTGKSTLAKKMAEHFKINYLDSGVLYRYATLVYLDKCLAEDTSGELVRVLSNTEVTLKDNKIYFDGHWSEKLPIRSPRITNSVSKLATLEEVREWVNQNLRKFAENQSLIMDGRDIGTTVFPNANLKIFVVADAKVRAKRRQKEMEEKGYQVSFEETLKNLKERDTTDQNRKISPLVQAKEALILDNSYLSFEAFIQKGIEMATPLF